MGSYEISLISNTFHTNPQRRSKNGLGSQPDITLDFRGHALLRFNVVKNASVTIEATLKIVYTTNLRPRRGQW